jgi:hypothetical protein
MNLTVLLGQTGNAREAAARAFAEPSAERASTPG